MSRSNSYKSWLEELREMAEIDGVNLEEDKYHYQTYFYRGYDVKSVIDEIKGRIYPIK